MLSKVLDKSTCAKCKFCCGFDKEDSWEIPVISEKLAKQLKAQGGKVTDVNGCFKFDLEFENDEVKYCPFHSTKTGCTLNDKEKPFDCKIWPLRVMKKDDKNFLTIAKTCPAFSNGKNELLQLVKDGLLEDIKDYISKNPYLINDLKEDYEILLEL